MTRRMKFWFSAKQKQGLVEIAEIVLLEKGKKFSTAFFLEVGAKLVEFTQVEVEIEGRTLAQMHPSWDDKQLVAVICDNPDPIFVVDDQRSRLSKYFILQVNHYLATEKPL